MNTQASITASLKLAKSHYENFPVASFLLPKKLREPIALIYAFARKADDFADEGDLLPEERLALINEFKQELDRIDQNALPNSELFTALQEIINKHHLPIQAFYDLLDAFSQDVTKTRYQDFGEVISYCRRSANPIGRLMLKLYQADTPQNIGMADAICSALQITNFLQDIAIDIQKTAFTYLKMKCKNIKSQKHKSPVVTQVAHGHYSWNLKSTVPESSFSLAHP